MLYSKSCGYAIRTLAFLSSRPKGSVLTVGELGRMTGVSKAYVAKVCRCLVGCGILNSRPGPRGGYSLKANPSKLTLLKVVESVDDLSQSTFAGCAMGLDRCGDSNPCPFHGEWVKAKKKVTGVLSKKTIADIARLNGKFYSGKKGRYSLSKRMRTLFSVN